MNDKATGEGTWREEAEGRDNGVCVSLNVCDRRGDYGGGGGWDQTKLEREEWAKEPDRGIDSEMKQ